MLKTRKIRRPFEYCHPDNNYNNDSFGSFLSKNRIFCSVNLHFMKVSTEIDNNFGYEKITQLVDNIPLRQHFHKASLECHYMENNLINR